MPENTCPARIGRKLDTIEVADGRADLVHGGEVRIYEAISGREDMHEVTVIPDKVADKPPRLLGHRAGQLLVEQRINATLARGCHHPVETKPFRNELAHALPGFWAFQHLTRGSFDALRSAEVPLCRETQKRFVRRTVPKEERQACSRSIGLPIRIRSLLDPEYEIRRLQHRLDDCLCAG